MSNNTNKLNDIIKYYSQLICSINDNDDEESAEKTLAQIENYFLQNKSSYKGEGRVWILIAEKNENKKIVLQIAQAEDIEKEINKNVTNMFNYAIKSKKNTAAVDLDILDKAQDVVINKYKFKHIKKNKTTTQAYMYRSIKKDFTKLFFYEVNIDDYLNKEKEMSEMENIFYQLAKDYCCEAKLAVELDPLCWNSYGSGVGKRFYMHFKKLKDDKNQLTL